ncbi:MAG: methionine ABC transporter permease [Legionellaceae bacterium]|nr:methionine ABC transporter permease [Legionellaceae bacterium]
MMWWYDVGFATLATLYMVLISTFLVVLFGLPLGTWLFCARNIAHQKWVSTSLDALINTFRSIPFIILLVALIPVTRFMIGTSIGIHAAIVPLSIAAIPFFARLVDNIYLNLPTGLLEAGSTMGANTFQMIRYILLPEACAPLIQASTVTAITLINYSAMAGAVGAGGLGDLAIRYGYQRFNIPVMIITIVILITMVHVFQWLGDKLSQRFVH